MNRLLRVMAILIGVLAVVVVAAALILPRVIDPNVYRDRIAALVKEKTGRELVIAGDIGWSVFPWLGVELGEVRLANAAGFGDAPFARVGGMQVRVKLLPLLRKEVEMSTVLLDGLQINLAKAKDGRTNWADLLPAAAPGKAQAKPKTAGERTAEPLAALAVGGVRVRDAQLIWDDQAAGTKHTIEDLNLQLGEIRADQPIAVDMNFTASGGMPKIESMVRLNGQVTPTQAFRHFAVRDLKLEVVAQGKPVPGGRLEAKLDTQLVYALDQRTLDINDLVLQAYDMTAHGQARGTDIGGDAPRLDGNLRVDQFVPRELLRALGQALPETSDPGVLNAAQGEFGFQASSAGVQFSKLKLQVDETALTGKLGVKNFARPALDFQLALDKLDLDRYLPPRKPEAANAAASAAEADEPESDDEAPQTDAGGRNTEPEGTAKDKTPAGGLFPVKTLRGLNLNGSLSIGALKAYQLRSSDVSITVSAKDGLVRLSPARAKMYQGSYNGNITVDVRGKRPRIGMDEKLAGVQLEPLLTDMLGKARITGTANMTLKLNAAGNKPRAIRQTMKGNASFAFTDGVVKGMDVLGEIRKAYAMVRGKAPANVSGETEFSALTGTATITKGVVKNPDLQGKSPLMQVQGNGTANLVTEALDYRITATLVDTLEGKGELTGRPIPVHITGSFSQPKVGVDLEQVLKQEVRKQVEKKLQDNLKGGLKGLLGK